jgi:hypothetical protein
MPQKLASVFIQTNKIIKIQLSRVYEEITNINLELISQYIELLDQQEKRKHSEQIDFVFSDIEVKFGSPTEHTPEYFLSLETAISPDLKALVDKGWGDILWEDVVKFKEKVASKIEKFITAIFDDRVELATKAITKAIAFYNYFLERQERYQQETSEQREAEKDWIDQQRRELERVQQGIEAILNTN